MINAGPCYRCKAEIWLPEGLYESAKRSSRITFWCPFGHEQHFVEGPTEAEKIRRERDRLLQENARLAEEAANAAEAARKADASLKRHKKRAAAGTCPCCQRTFKSLAEHMKHQHPEWVKDTGANVVTLKRKASP